MNVLHIDSSVLSDNSVSRQLTAQTVEKLKQEHNDLTVTYRDISAQPISHLSGEILSSRFINASEWNALQKEETALTETLLNELFAADIIVLGAPMYNFSIPSQLKSWIDRILVAGRTFKYTEQGPVGLVENKKVIIVSSRGGVYSTTDNGRMMDFQEDYLRTALGLAGIKDITVIRAEGVNVSAQNRAHAIETAQGEIAALVA